MASTYLSKTLSASNRKTWTFSTWVKRCANGAAQGLFAADASAISSGYFTWIGFQSSDILYFAEGATNHLLTNRVFRDNNAWYHIVLSCDTTQATSSDRLKIYVNGVQETSFSTETYPAQNHDFYINNNVTHAVGSGYTNTGATVYLDGSMAHTHFIDGTAYDASTFGETDATTGIWKPKTAPSVTYGTNGFFLKFENSGSMGTDSSGNANNFTVNGTLTQTVDTPSNVFCTLNPLDKGGGSYTFSNGNTTINTDGGLHSTLCMGAGKYYAEVKLTGSVNYGIGIRQQSYAITSAYGTGGKSAALYCNGATFYKNGTSTASYGSSLSTGDIVQIAVDLDNDNIYFGKNGSWWSGSAFDSATPSTAQSIDHVDDYTFSHILVTAGTGNVNWNFGNGYFGTTAVSSAQNPDDGIGIFEYDVPTGYRALCTKSINAEEYS